MVFSARIRRLADGICYPRNEGLATPDRFGRAGPGSVAKP